MAQGLSIEIDLRIVAPSLVMLIDYESLWLADCKILSIPWGPKVDLIKSEMAIAPTKECNFAI